MEHSPIGGITIETIKTFWNGLDWSVLISLLLSVIPALLCITFHELCHGFVAYKLGDNTAKNAGRLTLNPIKHIDIVGLIMMVVCRFGWAKPVPVNMYNFKNPKSGMAITALAGPVSNVVLAAFVMLIYGFLYKPLYFMGQTGQVLMETLTTTAYLSCAFAVFNLIPIPPLDGSKVVFSLLSEENYFKLMRYERYGMIILIVLVAFTNILTPILTIGASALFNWLLHIAEWSFSLTI